MVFVQADAIEAEAIHFLPALEVLLIGARRDLAVVMVARKRIREIFGFLVLIEMLAAPISGLVYMDGYLNVAYTLFDRAGQSVLASALVWLVSALLVWGAYECTLRAFRRAEAVMERKADSGF